MGRLSGRSEREERPRKRSSSLTPKMTLKQYQYLLFFLFTHAEAKEVGPSPFSCIRRPIIRSCSFASRTSTPIIA